MDKITKITRFYLNKAKIAVVLAVLAVNMPVQNVAAVSGISDITNLFNNNVQNDASSTIITGSDSLIGVNMPSVPKIMRVVITAYSSTPDQTKPDDPFTMASGKHVYDGAIAANFLAFGTKVKIPSLFGDKVFTVEDRMARKNNGKMDIWFPRRQLAKNFGVHEADVVILE